MTLLQARQSRGNTGGWSHFNPDTGMEWTKNHPTESGECPDASQIEAMTLAEFRRAYPTGANTTEGPPTP